MSYHKSNKEEGKTSLDLFVPESGKKSYKRSVRFAESIKRIFADIVVRNDFPSDNDTVPLRYGALVTITHVDMADDLRNVNVYISTLNQEDEVDALRFYEGKKHFFKDVLAHKTRMRYIPDIHFKIDRANQEAQKIDELLRKI